MLKLKLDENFDARLIPDLLLEGFDADTVVSEGLGGSSDETVYETCKSVDRVLVTLDLDFSNPLRFQPEGTPGILIVRPHRAVLSSVRATLWGALARLKSGAARGKLWIVEPGRIREHLTRESDTAD
jgi:predicted nuclease of predicted toxin-antitoxin system